jgi:hypothetical protein
VVFESLPFDQTWFSVFLPLMLVLAHLKQESLMHDQKSRGASKVGHRGKEETIVVN